MNENIDIIFNNMKEEYNKNHHINILDRLNYLKKLRTNIIKYEKDILDGLKLDLNKSEYEAYMTELGLVYKELNYFIKNTLKFNKVKKVRSSIIQFRSNAYIYHEPYGVVLIISPWNYPFYLTIMPLIAAISAGNRIILKPSEYSFNTTNIMNTIIKETFPSNYVSLIDGNKNISKFLTTLKFDYIFFTGSTNVGRLVYEEASKNLIPITLELGGKSPCIVTDLKHLNVAAKRLVFAKFINAGQTCIAPDYLYIEESLYEEFIKYLIIHIKDLIEENIRLDLYPKIISSMHYNRLLNLIKDEDIIYQSMNDENNLILGPYLINLTNKDSLLYKEEIFGPILPIIKFNNLDNLITELNNKDKPLSLYIYSDKENIIDKLINSLSFGSACINDSLVQITEKNLPFGGVGLSGINQYHGYYSFKTFSHEKAVLKREYFPDIKLKYGPFNKKTKMLRFLFKR